MRDGLISEYRESVNGCVAMAQLGVAPERIAKVAKRWAAPCVIEITGQPR